MSTEGAPSSEGGLGVRVHGLRRVYRGRRGSPDRIALDGVDLDVPRGQWVALLGANGSGKSTLLRILATLDAPDSGVVGVLGFSLPGDGARVRSGLGVVFQSASLDRLLTVEENLRLQCGLHGVAGAERGGRIDDLAGRLGFGDRMGDRVGDLSGGLLRRVDLARALLSRPDLLLLDEATAGLDPEARGSFFEQLERVRGEREMTVVMSTHHVDEAERCDRVVMMCAGRVVSDELLEEVRGSISGERTLETVVGAREVLQGCGITGVERGGRYVVRGAAGVLCAAAGVLVERGYGVRIGTTDLADLYYEASGCALGGADGAGGAA